MGVVLYNPIKNKFKKIILKSSLNDEQKKLWHSCIDKISDDEANSILEVLKEDVKNLDFLTKNLQDKMKAMKKGDKSAWQKIIREEKKFIEEK